jgi:hypothetical protein
MMSPKTLPTIWHIYMRLLPNIRFLSSIVAEKNAMKNEHICSMCIKVGTQEVESEEFKSASHDMGYLYDVCDQISDFCHEQLL